MKPAISPARTAAFDVLLRVETEQAFTSNLLPAYEKTLSNVDRALCHELVLGVLRRQIWLDRVIDGLAGGKRLDPEVRISLRLGIYQIQFLSRVPAHSAVNESVELVKRARKTSAKGFVNDILRRVTADRPEVAYDDEIDRLSAESSHPRWLVERWIAAFGREEAEKLVAADNQSGPTAFRVVRASADSDELIAGARASEHVPGAYVFVQAPVELFRLAEGGSVYVQDEASQMVATSVEIPPNGRAVDLCAAPGGKTGLIARTNTSGFVVAGDLYNRRVDLLRDNLRSQSVENAAFLRLDAERELPFADQSFDAVLVDAPCSGTGTIRRNPEIRYSLQPAYVTELASKQLRILHNASKLVKPGGLLVYSTCSLESEENEGVIRAFLETANDLEPTKPRVPERFITSDGFARTFPHRDGMDGFFIAAFRRRSG